MAQITINEGLAWLKTLKKRHEELLALRNDNAHREHFGFNEMGGLDDQGNLDCRAYRDTLDKAP